MKIIVPPKQSRSLIWLKTNALTAVAEPRSLEFQIRSLESEKIIIGSLESKKIGSMQVHTGYLPFSLKKAAEECWAASASVCFLKNKFWRSNILYFTYFCLLVKISSITLLSW